MRGKLTAALLLMTTGAQAFTTEEIQKYVTDQLWSTSISPSGQTVQDELEYEVGRWCDRVESEGRLEPAFFNNGVIGFWALFATPGEEAGVLSEALPYLSPALRERAKPLLRALVRDQDPTSFEIWGNLPTGGNRREYHRIPGAGSPAPLPTNIWPPLRPQPEMIYMVWRYARSTDDWDFVSTTFPPSGTRWNNIRSLFNTIPSTPTRYGQVAGAIGYARLLAHFGQTGSSDYAAALEKVRAGLTAGQNFNAFYQAAYSSMKVDHHHDWTFPPFHYAREGRIIGVLFAPEVGRFLGDHAMADVRKLATTNPAWGQAGELPGVEEYWPHWFLMRGDYPAHSIWSGHYGENHMVTPDIPWGLFMIHAYVYNEPGNTLIRYLDVPYSVGDLCHIQRLTATVQAFGQKSWSSSPPSQDGTPPAPPRRFQIR